MFFEREPGEVLVCFSRTSRSHHRRCLTFFPQFFLVLTNWFLPSMCFFFSLFFSIYCVYDLDLFAGSG